MKFLKTLSWSEFGEAVRTGQLKIQTGQWIDLGNDKPSRFIRVTKHAKTIMAIHPKGNNSISNKRFREAIDCFPR